MSSSETKDEDKAPPGRRKDGLTEERGAGQDKAVQSLKVVPLPPYQEVVLIGANLTPLGKRMSGPVITFIDRDMRRGGPRCDEPMVISVIAAEYKIERVLIDQGSSANILYWTTAKKLGVQNLTESQGALYDFAGERVPIKGVVEFETTFGDRSGVRTIPVVYTVVDVEADARIARRCYEDHLKAESAAKKLGVNVLDFDLDPRLFPTEERPHPVGDRKEVQMEPLNT
ncbi:hypothetical protein CR513_30596, partial [Mucuna pruriens]